MNPARPLDTSTGGECPTCGRRVRPLREIVVELAGADDAAHAAAARDNATSDPVPFALGWLSATAHRLASELACYARTHVSSEVQAMRDAVAEADATLMKLHRRGGRS